MKKLIPVYLSIDKKDISKLVKKVKSVTRKTGKTHKQSFWVLPEKMKESGNARGVGHSELMLMLGGEGHGGGEAPRIQRGSDIRERIHADRDEAFEHFLLLYEYQTDAEKLRRSTIYLNRVGFNKPDGRVFSDLMETIKAHGGLKNFREVMGERNWNAALDIVQARMPKYSNQLADIYNDNNRYRNFRTMADELAGTEARGMNQNQANEIHRRENTPAGADRIENRAGEAVRGGNARGHRAPRPPRDRRGQVRGPKFKEESLSKRYNNPQYAAESFMMIEEMIGGYDMHNPAIQRAIDSYRRVSGDRRTNMMEIMAKEPGQFTRADMDSLKQYMKDHAGPIAELLNNYKETGRDLPFNELMTERTKQLRAGFRGTRTGRRNVRRLQEVGGRQIPEGAAGREQGVRGEQREAARVAQPAEEPQAPEIRPEEVPHAREVQPEAPTHEPTAREPEPAAEPKPEETAPAAKKEEKTALPEDIKTEVQQFQENAVKVIEENPSRNIMGNKGKSYIDGYYEKYKHLIRDPDGKLAATIEKADAFREKHLDENGRLKNDTPSGREAANNDLIALYSQGQEHGVSSDVKREGTLTELYKDYPNEGETYRGGMLPYGSSHAYLDIFSNKDFIAEVAHRSGLVEKAMKKKGVTGERIDPFTIKTNHEVSLHSVDDEAFLRGMANAFYTKRDEVTGAIDRLLTDSRDLRGRDGMNNYMTTSSVIDTVRTGLSQPKSRDMMDKNNFESTLGPMHILSGLTRTHSGEMRQSAVKLLKSAIQSKLDRYGSASRMTKDEFKKLIDEHKEKKTREDQPESELRTIKQIDPAFHESLTNFANIPNNEMDTGTFLLGVSVAAKNGVVPAFLGKKEGQDLLTKVRRSALTLKREVNPKLKELDSRVAGTVYISNNPFNKITMSPGMNMTGSCQAIRDERGRSSYSMYNSNVPGALHSNQTDDLVAYTLDRNKEKLSRVSLWLDKKAGEFYGMEEGASRLGRIFGSNAEHNKVITTFQQKVGAKYKYSSSELHHIEQNVREKISGYSPVGERTKRIADVISKASAAFVQGDKDGARKMSAKFMTEFGMNEVGAVDLMNQDVHTRIFDIIANDPKTLNSSHYGSPLFSFQNYGTLRDLARQHRINEYSNGVRDYLALHRQAKSLLQTFSA